MHTTIPLLLEKCTRTLIESTLNDSHYHHHKAQICLSGSYLRTLKHETRLNLCICGWPKDLDLKNLLAQTRTWKGLLTDSRQTTTIDTSSRRPEACRLHLHRPLYQVRPPPAAAGILAAFNTRRKETTMLDISRENELDSSQPDEHEWEYSQSNSGWETSGCTSHVPK